MCLLSFHQIILYLRKLYRRPVNFARKENWHFLVNSRNVGTYRNISPCAISKGQDYLFFNSMSVLRRKHEFRLLTNKQQGFYNPYRNSSDGWTWFLFGLYISSLYNGHARVGWCCRPEPSMLFDCKVNQSMSDALNEMRYCFNLVRKFVVVFRSFAYRHRTHLYRQFGWINCIISLLRLDDTFHNIKMLAQLKQKIYFWFDNTKGRMV